MDNPGPGKDAFLIILDQFLMKLPLYASSLKAYEAALQF
jgi:hypothetical protein